MYVHHHSFRIISKERCSQQEVFLIHLKPIHAFCCIHLKNDAGWLPPCLVRPSTSTRQGPWCCDSSPFCPMQQGLMFTTIRKEQTWLSCDANCTWWSVIIRLVWRFWYAYSKQKWKTDICFLATEFVLLCHGTQASAHVGCSRCRKAPKTVICNEQLQTGEQHSTYSSTSPLGSSTAKSTKLLVKGLPICHTGTSGTQATAPTCPHKRFPLHYHHWRSTQQPPFMLCSKARRLLLWRKVMNATFCFSRAVRVGETWSQAPTQGIVVSPTW